MRRVYFGLPALLFIAAGCQPSAPPRSPSTPAPDTLRVAVHEAITGVDLMRIGLAGTIGDKPVDAETFTQVCKPVGMRAVQLGQETGWEVRQMAVKYRNPSNQADSLATLAINRFIQDAGVDTLWIRETRPEASGWRYLHRIEVQPSCLACHGARDSRPAFVVEKYADDRAFDFTTGDVRGVYSVFVGGR